MADGQPAQRPGSRKRIGAGGPEIVLTSYPPLVVVEHAPDQSAISLEVLANSRDLFVSGGVVYLGNNRAGEEIAYRVVGWDRQLAALMLLREPVSGPFGDTRAERLKLAVESVAGTLLSFQPLTVDPDGTGGASFEDDPAGRHRRAEVIVSELNRVGLI